MKMIENPGGVASGKIYNVGNPANDFSVRELATMMLSLAMKYPEYADSAKRVNLVETTAGAYYGAGYQDVQTRVPHIGNTMSELGWAPTHVFEQALDETVKWYLDHKPWWERILSGAYKSYFDTQYAGRLKT